MDGENRGRRVLVAVLGGEEGDRLGLQERVVAGQHEDVVLGVEVVERARRERDAHRVAGAALHVLLDELDRHLGDELLLERLGDPLGAVTDDDHDPLERQLGERVDHVQHHRAAAQLVQHLRRARTDARALPGGQHDGGERAVATHESAPTAPQRAARGEGFEPSLRASKDLVLPLHHPRQVTSDGSSRHALHRATSRPTEDRTAPGSVAPVMGSLIKKRRKRMRKKKHKKLLKKTRWQRRQQGK